MLTGERKEISVKKVLLNPVIIAVAISLLLFFTMQKPFVEQATELCRREMESLYADVPQFCNMFDYRAGNATADWGTSRTSIERSVTHLTGRPPQEGQK